MRFSLALLLHKVKIVNPANQSNLFYHPVEGYYIRSDSSRSAKLFDVDVGYCVAHLINSR